MTMPTDAPDQNPWGPPPAGTPGMPPLLPFQQPRNGLGVAALVVGIVGVLFAVVPLFFWLGTILGVLGLVFGIIGHSRVRKGEATNKGMALSGLVLGAIAVVVSIVALIVFVVAVKDFKNDSGDGIRKQDKGPAVAPTADPWDTWETPEPEPTETAPAALAFGRSHTYPDGVEITVSKPRSYQPDQFAVRHAKGNKAFQVTITIVNGSKTPLDLSTALPDASDAEGSPADTVFDGSDATEPFRGTVLPGKQAKSTYAFSMPAGAAREMQLEMAPKILEYDKVIWTGKTE
ncbi:DUF4190 domain-containing protein [Streptomyces sp. NPDC059875]|uniref:DUF4190 domain-containing protein n=1 Tax=unclassified Streptomyces TaxID=2593676 RepID=UPI003649DACB